MWSRFLSRSGWSIVLVGTALSRLLAPGESVVASVDAARPRDGPGSRNL